MPFGGDTARFQFHFKLAMRRSAGMGEADFARIHKLKCDAHREVEAGVKADCSYHRKRHLISAARASPVDMAVIKCQGRARVCQEFPRGRQR